MEISESHEYRPRGMARISGEDASEFLQGQFSQDLRVSDGTCVYGLWLNQKGKILGDSFLLRESCESYLAVSYQSDSEAICSNLESRIIMDEVSAVPCDVDWKGLSVWGEGIGPVVERLGMTAPEPGSFISQEGVYLFWGRRSISPNLEIVTNVVSATETLAEWIAESDVQILDTNAVASRAIRARRFEVGRDALDSDLPQESNLGETAVSYSKGCYIGQEVMARLKSMGRPRRSLEPVGLSAIPEGSGPWALLDGDGSRAGELRRAIESERAIVGSAMIKRSIVSQELVIDDQPEIKVERAVAS